MCMNKMVQLSHLVCKMFPRSASGLAALLSRRDRTRLHDRGVARRRSVDSPVGLLLAVGDDLFTFLPVFGDFKLKESSVSCKDVRVPVVFRFIFRFQA